MPSSMGFFFFFCYIIIRKFFRFNDIFFLITINNKNSFSFFQKALHWENDRHCVLSAVCHHLADWCRGTAERTVSMVTFVERSERIDDGIYSSCPVTVDNKGNIYVVRVNIYMLTYIFFFFKFVLFPQHSLFSLCTIIVVFYLYP